MRFKEWFMCEDTTVASAGPDNGQPPEDRGLYEPSGAGTYKPVPDSPLADRLFLGGKKRMFMRKGARNTGKRP